MKGLIGFLATLGAGAGLAYLFDPDQGRSRRARLRDKAISLSNSTQRDLGGQLRHLSNRARGIVAETRSNPRSL